VRRTGVLLPTAELARNVTGASTPAAVPSASAPSATAAFAQPAPSPPTSAGAAEPALSNPSLRFPEAPAVRGGLAGERSPAPLPLAETMAHLGRLVWSRRSSAGAHLARA